MRKTIILWIAALILWPAASMGQATIYPTVPGTSVRDYSQSGVRIEPGNGEVNVYQTLPGTNIRDFSKPGYTYKGDSQGRIKAYPTMPGTNIRDFSKPGFVIE